MCFQFLVALSSALATLGTLQSRTFVDPSVSVYNLYLALVVAWLHLLFACSQFMYWLDLGKFGSIYNYVCCGLIYRVIILPTLVKQGTSFFLTISQFTPTTLICNHVGMHACAAYLILKYHSCMHVL